MNVSFEPLQKLFDEGGPIGPELFKQDVYSHLKSSRLGGTPEATLRIDFSPEDGSDILIEKVDPENALGYNVFGSKSEYFSHLSNSQYVPSEEELMGEQSG